jgi:chorismate dehydratase
LKKANFKIAPLIEEDIPSVCAQKLILGKADIGLVPVAVLPEIKNHTIISDYCIGADGPVNSVLLLSEVPLHKIKTILLDYQSRTSVILARILAMHFWKINPEWLPTIENYESQIKGTQAGVVIGDRAFSLKEKFLYTYDLSSEWKKFTNLPFVFACWVSNQNPDKTFLHEFNLALKDGLNHIDLVAEQESKPSFSKEKIKEYLNQSIDFRFDNRKKEALQLFLTKTGTIGRE